MTNNPRASLCFTADGLAPPYIQTSTCPHVSYSEVTTRIVRQGGLAALGRGLGLKLVGNGVQGMVFSVLWKLINQKVFKND